MGYCDVFCGYGGVQVHCGASEAVQQRHLVRLRACDLLLLFTIRWYSKSKRVVTVVWINGCEVGVEGQT